MSHLFVVVFQTHWLSSEQAVALVYAHSFCTHVLSMTVQAGSAEQAVRVLGVEPG